MKIVKKVAPAFEDFIFDWDYERYLLIGGYGSGKSYQIALKIILKLLQERRRCLVVREVFDTLFESCYNLFLEILSDMGLLTTSYSGFRGKNRGRYVVALKSPLRIMFPNKSVIIFKGMDDPQKVKSINSVSIVWFEEASEIKFEGYKEMLGRIRTPNVSMHFILSCNPIGKDNWIYRHFFKRLDDFGNETTILDENELYEKKVIVKNGTYYHHSVPSDNPWLPWQYLKRLDDLRLYDYYLYMVARWGRFGTSGTRVLPQFGICKQLDVVMNDIKRLGPENQYFGFDFGFEESFNAVICMTVDPIRKYLYIWDEIYMNHVTDDKFAKIDEMQELRERLVAYNEQGYNKMIVADNEDPKAISYYRQEGYPIRSCRNKFVGSRLSNTRKVKRFRKIVVLPHCKNVIRELRDLTYKKDAKGNVIYDQFNIDPHSFSAIWYALDSVTVADVKDKDFNSKSGD